MEMKSYTKMRSGLQQYQSTSSTMSYLEETHFKFRFHFQEDHYWTHCGALKSAETKHVQKNCVSWRSCLLYPFPLSHPSSLPPHLTTTSPKGFKGFSLSSLRFLQSLPFPQICSLNLAPMRL
ncbi:hypothetical protein GBA52_023753 [Prunus armeniaca]|nr:hypothetical protein GBA52_023753 [Prunus armeniaca]